MEEDQKIKVNLSLEEIEICPNLKEDDELIEDLEWAEITYSIDAYPSGGNSLKGRAPNASDICITVHEVKYGVSQHIPEYQSHPYGDGSATERLWVHDRDYTIYYGKDDIRIDIDIDPRNLKNGVPLRIAPVLVQVDTSHVYDEARDSSDKVTVTFSEV